MSDKRRVTADRLADMSALERESGKIISSLIIRRREKKLRQQRLRIKISAVIVAVALYFLAPLRRPLGYSVTGGFVETGNQLVQSNSEAGRCMATSSGWLNDVLPLRPRLCGEEALLEMASGGFNT